MLGRPGRFGRGGRVVTASGLQGWARLGLVCVIGLIYLFLYKTIPVEVPVQVPYEKWESAAGAARDKVRKTWNAKGVQDILNSTLGFEEIFVINLPSRADRRDAMALAGAVSGLQLSYVDGVRGSDVEDRTLPADALDRRILPGNKGSWRAHMNALRTIVERNISTALILEDDVDWDVRVKSQMQSFALASRIFVQPVTGRSHAISKVYTPEPGTTSTSEDLKPAKDRNVLPVRSAPAYDKPVVSPYGDAFDVLWLGHCGTEFPAHPPALSRQHEGFSGPGAGRPAQLPLLRVTAARDATVPAPRHLRPHPFANPDAMAEQFAAHTRVVHAASATACTLAYAVSQAGARRLLRQFALETFTTGWDLMLGAWCDGLYMERGGGRGRGAKGERTPVCLAVQPPLFSHYLDEAKGSDIQAQGGGYLHKTGSQYIRLSVRANLRRLVEGSEEKDLVDQWPDEDV